MTDDELLTPEQIREWARRVWNAMSPRDQWLVAQGLSGWDLDERKAA